MITIGTRAPELALKQAYILRDKLISGANIDPDEIKIIPLQTTGDKIQNKSLHEIGGKGLFVKEVEEALLRGEIDIAIHSMKDMPSIIPEGLHIAAIIERDNPYDAFISNIANNLFELPLNATLGTCSPRRAAQILNVRPDIKIVPFRGNVGTRLDKLNSGVAEATLLAVAGLKRLDMLDNVKYSQMSLEEMLPAIGQGALCAQCREDDVKTRELLSKINDEMSYKTVECERVFLEGLNADCNKPVAGHAFIEGDQISFTGLVASMDGSKIIKAHSSGSVVNNIAIGNAVLDKIKSQMPDNFLD